MKLVNKSNTNLIIFKKKFKNINKKSHNKNYRIINNNDNIINSKMKNNKINNK